MAGWGGGARHISVVPPPEIKIINAQTTTACECMWCVSMTSELMKDKGQNLALLLILKFTLPLCTTRIPLYSLAYPCIPSDTSIFYLRMQHENHIKTNVKNRSYTLRGGVIQFAWW